MPLEQKIILSQELEGTKVSIWPIKSNRAITCLLFSGLLLITPGFFTDCVGFAVFLKPVQDFIAIRAKSYFVSRSRRY